MAQSSEFDQLVRRLNSKERQDLLSKIESSFSSSIEPLMRESEGEVEVLDVEYELRKMGLFQRFVFYLVAIFTNRGKTSLMREYLLGRIRRQIMLHTPGLIDHHASRFGDRMFVELTLLMEGARYFQAPLREAMDTARSDFFAFLVGMQVEDIQSSIDSELWPLVHVEDFELDEVEISKKDLLDRFDKIVEEIPGEDRTQIYRDAQALSGLYNLSRFHFGEILACFKASRVNPGKECEFQAISAYLVRLCELISAAQYSPSATALRALFLFFYRDRLADEDYDMEEQLLTVLTDAESALAKIREFNLRVPLLLIIKYITHDVDFMSRKSGGAEDWFFAFKDYWINRIERAYLDFTLRKKRKQLMESTNAFLGIGSFEEFGRGLIGVSDGALEVKYRLSLSFMKRFAAGIFRRVSRALGVIYLNGEFYKEQNRKEFTDSYEFLKRLEEKIASLEKRLQSGGDWASRIEDVQKQTISLKQRQEKIQTIQSELEQDSLSILDGVIKELNNLVMLLGGILHGEPGARFDTLSNFGSLGGRNNRVLVTTWERALDEFSEALNMLVELKEVETNWGA